MTKNRTLADLLDLTALNLSQVAYLFEEGVFVPNNRGVSDYTSTDVVQLLVLERLFMRNIKQRAILLPLSRLLIACLNDVGVEKIYEVAKKAEKDPFISPRFTIFDQTTGAIWNSLVGKLGSPHRLAGDLVVPANVTMDILIHDSAVSICCDLKGPVLRLPELAQHP
jgi:hypothetical protein